jgi:HK97 family phage major capsid protein
MTATPHTRTLELGRADPASQTVECSISSEEPCDRGGYIEILSHDPAHIDMVRARTGLPLIESHDHHQVNVGIVEQLRVVGGKLRGIARFGKSQRGRELFEDVKDGIVRNLSVGYYLLKEVGRDAADVVRFAWQPFEVSIVAIPADTTVGFNRSIQMHTQNEAASGDEPHQSRSQRRAATREDTVELERRDTIRAIGDQYARHLRPNDAADAVRRGDSVEQFKELILSRMESPHTDTSVRHSGEAREWQRMASGYSLARAVQLKLDPAAGLRAGGGLEREVDEELSRQFGRQAAAGGFWVPDAKLYGRGLTIGTASTSAGALHAGDFHGDLFADAFRANTVVGALGANILTGQTSDIIIPRKTATSTMGWVSEVGTAAESTPDFGQLVLKPKRISTFVVVSQQSLIQSGLGLENLIRDDLVRGMMVEIDRVSLTGAGTGSEPTGVVNTSGIGTVTGGTNGAAILYGHLVDLEAACANANASVGASGFVVNPKTRAYLKKSAKVAGGAVTELAWNDAALDANGIGVVCGHRAGVTTHMRSNLTKGTSTTICSELLFSSDWSELILARFGGNEVIVDPYSLATTGQVRITLNGFTDVGVRRAAGFGKMPDALTA